MRKPSTSMKIRLGVVRLVSRGIRFRDWAKGWRDWRWVKAERIEDRM